LEAALTCNTSSLPVQPPTDLMEYDCKLKCSPGCTKTFKESPSKWTNMTTCTTGGTAFQVRIPKSCKPCRDHDKASAGTVAALIVASPFDDYQSDFDEETYANELSGYDSHWHSLISIDVRFPSDLIRCVHSIFKWLNGGGVSMGSILQPSSYPDPDILTWLRPSPLEKVMFESVCLSAHSLSTHMHCFDLLGAQPWSLPLTLSFLGY
jgi:hypothetical protein